MALSTYFGLPDMLPGDFNKELAFRALRDHYDRRLGNTPACRAYNNAAQSIAHNSFTPLAMPSEDFDTDAIHDTVTNNSRLTIKTAGTYLITGYAQISNSAAGIRQLHLRINGSNYVVGQVMIPNATNYMEMSLSLLYKFALNDYFELTGYQDSGGGLNFNKCALACVQVGP